MVVEVDLSHLNENLIKQIKLEVIQGKTDTRKVSCDNMELTKTPAPARQSTLVGFILSAKSTMKLTRPTKASRYQIPGKEFKRLFFCRPHTARVVNQFDLMDPKSKMQRVEAVLLISREPVNTRQISKLANLADGTEARTLIRLINRKYKEFGRAFRIERIAGGYQMMTREKLANWIRRLHGFAGEQKLSDPALETLAIVAFRQPVLRADIEQIRGVACGEVLRQLMERKFVKISGRSEELGRPFLYTTTKFFLKYFGLDKIEDLPKSDYFRKTTVNSFDYEDDIEEYSDTLEDQA